MSIPANRAAYYRQLALEQLRAHAELAAITDRLDRLWMAMAREERDSVVSLRDDDPTSPGGKL